MKEKANFYDFARMCNFYGECTNCPFNYEKTHCGTCNIFMGIHPDKANEIIINWREEHPIKTRQSEFLKMFPNAKIDNGVVVICPKNVEATLRCGAKDCGKCSEEYWLAEVDE